MGRIFFILDYANYLNLVVANKAEIIKNVNSLIEEGKEVGLTVYV